MTYLEFKRLTIEPTGSVQIMMHEIMETLEPVDDEIVAGDVLLDDPTHDRVGIVTIQDARSGSAATGR